MLKNKRILFISPEFFNYEKHITLELVSKGAMVDFYNERPSNSILTKGLIRVNKNLIKKKIDAYYHEILIKIKNKKYDFFFLIKGESIPSFFLKELKINQPNCSFIYYNYDSFQEYPTLVKLLNFFDKKITFDRKDAEKYSLDFLPLFYTSTYRENTNKTSQEKYTLSFIGSIHTDRYKVAHKVDQVLKNQGYSTFIYFYAPNRISLWLKKLFDKNFKGFKLKYIQYKSLTEKEIIRIYESSTIILDICKPFQNGLTMRTFEALAMDKKLITTNQNIKYYPFYHPENIFIIDRNNIKIPKSFIEGPTKKLEDSIIQSYSLSSWIEAVFSLN